MNTKKAFTIIELIIVLAVIGILAAILIIGLPKVIESANKKSAYSDAKNALKTTLAQLQSDDGTELLGDSIFIVSKAKKYYVYGYYAFSNTLYESENNPYDFSGLTGEFNSIAEQIIASLEAADDIGKSGETQKNISDEIKDLPASTKVFSGYRLLSILDGVMLNKARIDLDLGEVFALKAEKLMNLPLVWESADAGIATVDENGNVTATGYGNTVVTVTCGNTTAACKVYVHEYIEFNGTMKELKDLIESSEPAAFIKLTHAEGYLTSDDPQLFPITIPKGKTVRIDFNRVSLSYMSVSDKELTECISAFFLNDGGSLFLLSTGLHNEGSISINMDFHIDTGIRMGHIIKNINSAYTEFADDISVNVYCSTDDSWSFDATILNSGNSTLIFKNGGVYAHNGSIAIHNEAGSLLSIYGGAFNSSGTVIKNEGVIDIITGDAKFESPMAKFLIDNTGEIKQISGGNYLVGYEGFLEFTGVTIYSHGENARIEEISGGEFMAHYNDCMRLDKGYLGKITGGTFKSGTNAITYVGANENDLKIGEGISGGEFSHEISSRYLAKGFVCVKNNETGLYEVKPE
jgi:prepilin-type N-terminal cleavage/methylation domain-containing protein